MYSAIGPTNCITSGLPSDGALLPLTMSLPFGLLNRPQVRSYSPASRFAVSFWVKPGAIFSRSSTTITPFRISHSSPFWLLFWMMNWVLPAFTVTFIGSHCLSFTLILTCGISAAIAAAEPVSKVTSAAFSACWRKRRVIVNPCEKLTHLQSRRGQRLSAWNALQQPVDALA